MIFDQVVRYVPIVVLMGVWLCEWEATSLVSRAAASGV